MKTISVTLPTEQMQALQDLARGVKRIGNKRMSAMKIQRENPTPENTRRAIDLHNRYCRAVDEYHAALLSCYTV